MSAEYDRAERKDFVKEASLAGQIAKVKYELTTRFGGATGLSLETTTDDGTTVEAEGSMECMSSMPKISKVSASRAATLRGTDCNLQISHEVNSRVIRISSRRSIPSPHLTSPCLALPHVALPAQVDSSESKLKLSTLLGSGVKAVGTLATKGGSHDTSYEIEYDTTLTEG